MESKTLASLETLKALLKEDPRVLSLSEKEKTMSSNNEVVILSNAMNRAKESYEECLSRYGENSPLTKASSKTLYEAKLALDNHPLVKDYTQAYVLVRDLYLYIDDILFSDFRESHSCGGKR